MEAWDDEKECPAPNGWKYNRILLQCWARNQTERDQKKRGWHKAVSDSKSIENSPRPPRVKHRPGHLGWDWGTILEEEPRLPCQERWGAEWAASMKPGVTKSDLSPETKWENSLPMDPGSLPQSQTKPGMGKQWPMGNWSEWMNMLQSFLLSMNSELFPHSLLGCRCKITSWCLSLLPNYQLELYPSELQKLHVSVSCFFIPRNICWKTWNHTVTGSFHHYLHTALPARGQVHPAGDVTFLKMPSLVPVLWQVTDISETLRRAGFGDESAGGCRKYSWNLSFLVWKWEW